MILFGIISEDCATTFCVGGSLKTLQVNCVSIFEHLRGCYRMIVKVNASNLLID